MLMRVFVSLIIILAIVLGLVVLYPSGNILVKVIVFRNFFDTALPILGFGALIKFLCTGWDKY